MMVAQIGLIQSLLQVRIAHVGVMLLYHPTAQDEQYERGGHLGSARAFGRLISTLPMALEGAPVIHLFDIGGLQRQYFFQDTVLTNTKTSFLPVLFSKMEEMEPKDFPEQMVLVFRSDLALRSYLERSPPGSAEWFDAKLNRGEWALAGEQDIPRPEEGVIRYKDVAFLMNTIFTMEGLRADLETMKKYGANSLSLYSVHVQEPIWDQSDIIEQLAADKFLRRIVVTDSNPQCAAHLKASRIGDKVEIVDIAPIVANTMLERFPRLTSDGKKESFQPLEKAPRPQALIKNIEKKRPIIN